jgi:hypothetical protein
MVQLIEEPQIEKPKKKKLDISPDGRWGISFMFGGHELFIGLSISKADVPELVKVKRRTEPGKGKVYNL